MQALLTRCPLCMKPSSENASLLDSGCRSIVSCPRGFLRMLFYIAFAVEGAVHSVPGFVSAVEVTPRAVCRVSTMIVICPYPVVALTKTELLPWGYDAHTMLSFRRSS